MYVQLLTLKRIFILVPRFPEKSLMPYATLLT